MYSNVHATNHNAKLLKMGFVRQNSTDGMKRSGLRGCEPIPRY
jgi:hypothetical protein